MDTTDKFATIILILAAVLVVGLLFISFVRGIAEIVSNFRQRVITRRARVVAKRTEVGGGRNNLPASTTYYVTFENDEDGTRQEFYVSRNEYGLLAEGDRGSLSSRGTWYAGFKRATTARKGAVHEER